MSRGIVTINSGSTFMGKGGTLNVIVKTTNLDWVFSLSGDTDGWCSIVGADSGGTYHGSHTGTVTISAATLPIVDVPDRICYGVCNEEYYGLSDYVEIVQHPKFFSCNRDVETSLNGWETEKTIDNFCRTDLDTSEFEDNFTVEILENWITGVTIDPNGLDLHVFCDRNDGTIRPIALIDNSEEESVGGRRSGTVVEWNDPSPIMIPTNRVGDIIISKEGQIISSIQVSQGGIAYATMTISNTAGLVGGGGGAAPVDIYVLNANTINFSVTEQSGSREKLVEYDPEYSGHIDVTITGLSSDIENPTYVRVTDKNGNLVDDWEVIQHDRRIPDGFTLSDIFDGATWYFYKA